MTSNIAFIDAAVAEYLVAHTTPPTDLEQRLIDKTQTMTSASMQIGPNQAQFMAMLAALLQPKLVIEVGTFTGYSALVVAQALTPEGRMICCDTSREWTQVGRPFWDQAGVADRIDLRLGMAGKTLRALPPDTQVDMAFIDADKRSYLEYYELLLPLLSPHGVILVDNVLWDGRVADPGDRDSETVALRQFNDHVLADPRVQVALLPIGDGLSFITRSLHVA